MSTAAQLPQMKLRLPETLKDWLTAQAEVNRRSVNAEVVFRLQTSLLAGAGFGAEKENAPLEATGEAL